MQYGCEVDRKTEFWNYVRHSVIIIRMHTRNGLAGRKRLETYYSWENNAKVLQSIYERIAVEGKRKEKHNNE